MRRERLFRALVLYWQGLRAEIGIVRTVIKLQLPILSQPVVGISSKSNPRALNIAPPPPAFISRFAAPIVDIVDMYVPNTTRISTAKQTIYHLLLIE